MVTYCRKAVSIAQVITFAIVLILMFAGSTAKAESEPSKKLGKLLGDKQVSILQAAKRVEVFRIDPDPEKPGKERIGGFAITATGKEQGKSFAAKLTQVLLRDETYFNPFAKCFDPGVAFRIWSDKEAIDVAICFRCDNLAVSPKGKPLTREIGSFHESASRNELIRLAKDAFPNDKAIQALKEE